jgi:hypothetical protein
MKEMYSRARICPHSINSVNYNYRQSGSCDLVLDPGKTNHMFFQIITKTDHYIRCHYVTRGSISYINNPNIILQYLILKTYKILI